ncbi:MAG: ACP S-malonyltransferase [Rickettsiales bacterium]
MATAFLFPGQGSQAVGMAKDVADAFVEARHVLEEIEDALKLDLRSVMFDGPDELLRQTSFTQPALMAASMAVFAVLQTQGNVVAVERPTYYAGHSLGEYSALCAAGALSLGDAATALRIRGQAMQGAVAIGEGAMAALLGVEPAQAEEIAQKASAFGVCELANDNGGGQCVISGHAAAVEKAAEIAKECGVRKVAPLPVSAPFHCSLMRPAAEVMARALEEATWRPLSVPVVDNVTAQAESDPAHIKELLVKQVTGRVRWRESMEYMRENGVMRYVEIGSGNVLCGLAKRIDRQAETVSLRNCADIDAYLTARAA